MQNKLEEIIRDCKEKAVSRNLEASELISYLYEQKVNIIDSIKVVSRVFSLSIGEAKKLVASHSAWLEVAESAEPLHDEMIRALHGDTRGESQD